MILNNVGRGLLAVPAVLAALAGPAAAQPTAEQQNALRQNCRSDFMSNCSGVTPGGAEALQCLQRNVARLSPGCQNAVNALTPRSPAPTPAPAAVMPQPSAPPPPPPAAATAPATPPAAAPPAAATAPAATPRQPTAQEQAAIRSSCQTDFLARCRGVQPGGVEALQCLQRNAATASPGCQRALSVLGPAPTPPAAAAPAAPPRAPAAPPPAVAAPAPVAPPPVAAPVQPTAQQQAAIRSSCQSDFMSRCRGVQPGGAEAMQCLQRNAAQVSPACRSALSVLSPAPTPPAAAAPAAPAPAPTAAPVQPTAQQQAAIRSSCQSDFMSRCRGVQPGGAEALQCLQRNATQVSPGCRSALSAISGAPAAAAPAAPAAAPPPAASAPMPPLPPRALLAIRRSCDGDMRAVCPQVPIGGGRIVECLVRNEPALSPTCKAALASARR